MYSIPHQPDMIAEVIDQNISRIKTDLDNNGLTYDSLQDDVLDHICCMLEEEMESGEDFDTSYEKVFDSIGEKTLGNLQHKTLLLLDKKFQQMKNFTYLFGLTTAIIAIVGALFKKMHWPGAGIMLTVGIGLVLLVFLPLYFIVNYKEQPEKKNPVYAIVGFLTIAVLLCSALFKIQHWSGANILIETSLVLLIVGFVPLYVVNVFQKAGKQKAGLPYVVMVLIGLAVVVTFFNVNMSKDMLDVYRDGSIANKQMIESVENNTEKMLTITSDTSFAAVNTSIIKIHQEAVSLQLMVRALQEDMCAFVNQAGVSLEEINKIDNKAAGREVILDSGNGRLFALAFSDYKEIIKLTIKDPVVLSQIEDHLDFNGSVIRQGAPWSFYVGMDDVHRQPFMQNYYNLSHISRGIALSEYVAIANMMHQVYED